MNYIKVFQSLLREINTFKREERTNEIQSWVNNFQIRYFTQAMIKPATKQVEMEPCSVSLEAGNSSEGTIKYGLAPQNLLMTWLW